MIKTTPAVASGLTDHVWTLEELIYGERINVALSEANNRQRLLRYQWPIL